MPPRKKKNDDETQAPSRPSHDDRGAFVGNAETVAFFGRLVERGQLAHAYLFVGPEHVGKTTFARRLALRLLNAERLETSPDFFQLERAPDPKTGKPRDTIAIAQVHELRGALARTSFSGGRKVAVLVGADRLGREAANALLKTLEEPEGDTVMFLTAASAADVLPTVRSRCQEARFARVPRSEITAALAARRVDAEVAATAASLADGRPGLAFAYAGGGSSSGGDLARLSETVARRRAVLAMPGQTVAERWRVVEEAVPPKIAFVEAGERASAFLDLAAELLHDALLLSGGLDEQVIHADARDAVASFATALGPVRLAAALTALGPARARLAANVSPRSVLESFVLHF